MEATLDVQEQGCGTGTVFGYYETIQFKVTEQTYMQASAKLSSRNVIYTGQTCIATSVMFNFLGVCEQKIDPLSSNVSEWNFL
jgi:hypothetical protein